jgi:hypothetical protein
MDHTQITLNYAGFYKIWKVHKKTGKKELLVDKKNLILYQGADLLAFALAGVKYSSISHMYVGYNDNPSFSFPANAPTIDKEYSTTFASYGSGSLSNFGYLRLPLAYTPSYLAASHFYNNNTVIFTSVIATTDYSFGAAFNDSLTSPSSQIFEIGLAASLNPDNAGNDIIFSRANFTPIIYDSNYNLTITWGICFLS